MSPTSMIQRPQPSPCRRKSVYIVAWPSITLEHTSVVSSRQRRTSAAVASGVVLALLYFPAQAGIPLVLTLYFQRGLGYSALHTALAVTAFAVGSAVASDAFFPFPDGLEAAVAHGVTAVIQPGGSIGDQKVIDAANERGLAMVFTGVRVFRH